MRNPKSLPQKRGGLMLSEVGDEFLVYDSNTNESHCLSPLLGQVYKQCDGKTPFIDAAKGIAPGEEGQDLLSMALHQLGEKGLVEASFQGLSRRDFIARWGQAAAALVVVTSASMPTPANAQSNIPLGQGTCSGVSDCATGVENCDAGICCNNLGSACVTANGPLQCCGVANDCQANICCVGPGATPPGGLAASCCSGAVNGFGQCT